MKKIILLGLLVSGCTTWPDPEMMIVKTLNTTVQPARGALTVPLSSSQIYASRLNSLASGLAGPNQVSAGLLEFQNYNRAINNTLASPWETLLLYRPWLR